MTLHIKDVKNVCSKILYALDTSIGPKTFDSVLIRESIELFAEGTTLYATVHNDEYTVQGKIQLDEKTDFKATVSASTFLKLMSMITTEVVEFETSDNALLIRGNGEYNLPYVFDNKTNEMISIPVDKIDNVTSTFELDSKIFASILTYNSREINNKNGLYYIDSEGAITFSQNTACINSFKIDSDVKLLFNTHIVKLFKLFEEGMVKVTVGNKSDNNLVAQTWVQFETPCVTITALSSCSPENFRTIPVKKIRERAFEQYPYTISSDKETISQAINRLMLLAPSTSDKTLFGWMDFGQYDITLSIGNKKNHESVLYNGTSPFDANKKYSMGINLTSFKSTVDGCSEDTITLGFGNRQAIVSSHNNIINVHAETIVNQH